MLMTNTVPDRVENFGSDKTPVSQEPKITHENLDSHKERLPKPTGYRILILPFTMSSITKGGIHLASQTVDKERLATVVGYVVSLGPDAYGDLGKFPDGAWCKEGDWVVLSKYTGHRFEYDGCELRLINDDSVLAVVEDPTKVSRANA